jgi:hypothetical protein
MSLGLGSDCGGILSTCDVYSSMGAGSPDVATGISCKHTPCMPQGLRSEPGALQYTDVILVADTVDVRDGCTRTAGTNAVTYGDGYKVAIPSGGTTYSVVWVETVNRGMSSAYKRVYLMRDAAAWPGP